MYKRLIGVLAVRDGILVKSYGYEAWRPAGRLPTALENLDRWGADEILILDISRRSVPDPHVLRALHSTAVSTPITYGGGIRTFDHVQQVLDVGADRILVESLLWTAPNEVDRIADTIGAQAIVASIPITSHRQTHRIWSPPETASRRSRSIDSWIKFLLNAPVEEVLVIDVTAEGRSGAFSLEMARKLAPQLADAGLPTIWFGGLDTSKGAALLEVHPTTGIAFGNILHEGELVLHEVRKQISKTQANAVRPVRTRHA